MKNVRSYANLHLAQNVTAEDGAGHTVCLGNFCFDLTQRRYLHCKYVTGVMARYPNS